MFKTKKDKLEKEYMKENSSELDELKKENEPLTDNDSSEESIENESEEKVVTNEQFTAQLNNLKDQLLRKAAEFENYKKRSENELSSFFKYANESLLIELLPVLDDFERVNKSWSEKHDLETYKKGVELIYEKLKGVLKKQGLKEMETDGKEFDFNLHDALLQTPDENHDPNTILETVEKGYYLKDKVLRHAKVIVSSKPSDTEEDEKNK